ncbi:MAG: hypothetical protein JWM83_901 [Candidatus Angelobacter sp.]|nr:hypothetical protein [Candidatus Angelobacter sp.]
MPRLLLQKASPTGSSVLQRDRYLLPPYPQPPLKIQQLPLQLLQRLLQSQNHVKRFELLYRRKYVWDSSSAFSPWGPVDRREMALVHRLKCHPPPTRYACFDPERPSDDCFARSHHSVTYGRHLSASEIRMHCLARSDARRSACIIRVLRYASRLPASEASGYLGQDSFQIGPQSLSQRSDADKQRHIGHDDRAEKLNRKRRNYVITRRRQTTPHRVIPIHASDYRLGHHKGDEASCSQPRQQMIVGDLL